jgi:hypothetical protein
MEEEAPNGSKHFEIEATDRSAIRNTVNGEDRYGWKRFVYLTILGKTESVCILAVASKYGISQNQRPG